MVLDMSPRTMLHMPLSKSYSLVQRRLLRAHARLVDEVAQHQPCIPHDPPSWTGHMRMVSQIKLQDILYNACRLHRSLYVHHRAFVPYTTTTAHLRDR